LIPREEHVCVIRISGPYDRISVSVLGASLDFSEAVATVRKRRLGQATERDSATFLCVVGDADGDDVPAQIEDAVRFLTRHRAEMKELRSRDGVDLAVLDFAWDVPLDRSYQWNRFPRMLLDLCVDLDLDLEISVYAVDHKPDSGGDSGGQSSSADPRRERPPQCQ